MERARTEFMRSLGYGKNHIFNLDLIYINGGRRGMLLEMSPEDLELLLEPTRVTVAIQGGSDAG